MLPFKRLLRHRWIDLLAAPRAVSIDSLLNLQHAVEASEHQHSGEIRICIETTLPSACLLTQQSISKITRERALNLFSQLGVWDTSHNNGVFIYLLIAERAIEIVADRGLNERVAKDQWTDMVSAMSGQFIQGHFEAGLMQVIAKTSAVLVRHFPLDRNQANPNELPDFPSANPSQIKL